MGDRELMVQFQDPECQKRSGNIWTWCKIPLLTDFMMKNINNDFLTHAREEPPSEQLEDLLSCAKWGADPDYRDADGNTALHLALMRCRDHVENLQEGRDLGLINMDPDNTLACTYEEYKAHSVLKPKSKEARQVINAQIKEWRDNIQANYDSVLVLLEWGQCDPLAENNAGQTCVDLAKSKAMIIRRTLDARIWADKLEEEVNSIEDPDEKRAARKEFKAREKAERGLKDFGWYLYWKYIPPEKKPCCWCCPWN